MWRTQYGNRTLEDAEAVIFAEALMLSIHRVSYLLMATHRERS